MAIVKLKLFALIIIAGHCLPLFSLDKSIIFDTGAAFSWYPYNDFADFFDAEHLNYNLQLNMGLKLFEKVSTYFNLDIDDPTMKKFINIAGSIGSKYFGIQLDYHKVSGRLNWEEYWHNVNTSQTLDVDFNQHWTTVALIFPRIMSKPGNIGDMLGGDILFGFFWNHSTIPLTIDRNESNTLEALSSTLDPEFVSNTWGLRFSITQDMITKHRTIAEIFDLPNLPFDIFYFFNVVLDIGIGIGKPSENAVFRAREKGWDYQGNDLNMLYIKTRDMFGIGKEWELGDNFLLNFTVGVDYTLEMFQDFSGHSSLDTRSSGPFVRIGAMF
jgi:hypothetical protein